MNMEYNGFRDDVEKVVLLAPAGAGKTTWCIERINELLVTADPLDIAFNTFTRRGIQEGKSRVMEKFRLTQDDLYYFSTWHAMTFRELGYKREQLFTAKHRRKFNSFFSFQLQDSSKSDAIVTYDSKLMALYDAERSGKSIVDEVYDIQKYTRFVSAYEAYKEAYGVKDFFDCLIDYTVSGKPLPVKYGFIDEAQDLSSLQWKVAYRALANCEKIFIAGDDYQSIYKYAGAKPETLINLANNCKVEKLEKSYRLSRKVYELAKTITDSIGVAVQKDYVPAKDTVGKVEVISEREQLYKKLLNVSYEEKPYTDWFLLYRCNTHLDDTARFLMAQAIPFHDNRGFCIREQEFSFIERYVNYSKDVVGFGTEIKKEEFAARYGVEDFSLHYSEQNFIAKERALFIQSYIEKYGFRKLKIMAMSRPTILLSTVHKIKGGEAQNVAFFMDCTKKVYASRYADMDSELRLLYVACTRAIENLYLIKSSSRYGLDDIILTLKDLTQ